MGNTAVSLAELWFNENNMPKAYYDNEIGHMMQTQLAKSSMADNILY